MKVTPKFCFPFKISDDPTASICYHGIRIFSAAMIKHATFPHTFRINSQISQKNGKRKKERVTVIALGAQKMEVGTFFLTTVLISRTNVKGLKQFFKK